MLALLRSEIEMVIATAVRKPEMSLQEQVKNIVELARDAEAHVVSCSPATLRLAVIATLYAWTEYKYHLCVRSDRDHPQCHDLRSRAVEV